MSEAIYNSREIQGAFVEHDRKVILNNIKVGCFLGIILMPVGTALDYVVYRADVVYLLKLRLLCSLFIAAFWVIVVTPFGHKHPRKLGVLLAMFPAFSVSWMIYLEEGSSSPYYAGLNLAPMGSKPDMLKLSRVSSQGPLQNPPAAEPRISSAVQFADE